MHNLDILAQCLSGQALISEHTIKVEKMPMILQVAQDMYDRQPTKTRPLQSFIDKIELGFIAEIGMEIILRGEAIWARPSPSTTYEERKYDIEFYVKDDWLADGKFEKHLLEVKMVNKDDRYFEFNTKFGHGGLNLTHFIASEGTKYLATASVTRNVSSDGVFLGWIVKPMYVFHRNFLSLRETSSRNFGCDSYVWYDSAIQHGLCRKIIQD